jgi:hypothetical protein
MSNRISTSNGRRVVSVESDHGLYVRLLPCPFFSAPRPSASFLAAFFLAREPCVRETSVLRLLAIVLMFARPQLVLFFSLCNDSA